MNKQFKSIVDMIGEKYPFVFFDVGAMGGIPRKWLPLSGNMKVIGFEPDSREFDKLANSKDIKYFNCALNEKSEELSYYITRVNGRSSIFRPNKDMLAHYENPERFDIVQEEVIPSIKVKDLDSVIEENSITDADFIKLDTQGSELQILKGGQKQLIPKIFGVQVEVEFIEMYKQQPLFRHVDDFLVSKGFVLMDLRRQYWKRKDYYRYRGKGQLIFGDALYFKNIDTFFDEIALLKNSAHVKTKVFKAILICLVYKMFDYAVSVAKSGLRYGYLTDDEHGKINSIIKSYAQKGVPVEIHLGVAYKLFNKILQKFRPPSYLGWADSDPEIGNIKDL